MDFLNRLEFKFGRYAIKNLNFYICAMHVIGLIISIFSPAFYYSYLSLDSIALVHGQFWRIFTFLFAPPTDGFVLFSLLIIYVYWQLSTELIVSWGAFKFNLYFFIGILGHLLASVVLGLLDMHIILYPTYLMFSIFIAYSFTFGDALFLLFFFIPVKAKYLALFEIALYIYIFIHSGFGSRVAIVLSLLNIFVFMYLFYKDRYGNLKNFINQINYEIKNMINDIKRMINGRRY